MHLFVIIPLSLSLSLSFCYLFYIALAIQNGALKTRRTHTNKQTNTFFHSFFTKRSRFFRMELYDYNLANRFSFSFFFFSLLFVSFYFSFTQKKKNILSRLMIVIRNVLLLYYFVDGDDPHVC